MSGSPDIFFLMHSGFLLLLWLMGAAGLQLLPLGALSAVLLMSGFIAWRIAPLRAARLLRRVRVLLIAICVFFGGFTPGEALWAEFPALSPTREGVFFALEHVARLLTVVLWVALLLERLETMRLVAGLYALLWPLRIAGVPAERLAVRLLLVLRYVESAPAGAWRHWLESIDEPSGRREDDIRIARECLGWREGVIAIALCTLGLATVLGVYA